MTTWTRRAVIGSAAVLSATVLLRAQGAAPPAPAQAAIQTLDYAKDIQPIFEKYCADCHGRSKARAQLRLHSPEWVKKGGQSGAIVIAGNSHGSELMRRVLDENEDDRMPLDADPLPAGEIAKLRSWIDQGAPMPAGAAAAADTIEQHWAYVKPKRPDAPAVTRKDWVRTPIDAFVLARLEHEKLSPSPEASKTTLLRRVSLDLIGLPPTPEEVDAFVADKSPDAYEKAVDRLLASPHFGERWARPWLDLARYADTNGYEKDNRREIWKYRDWVIGAFNRDLPFDQFTIEQIAGDMLPNATIEQKIATGFHRNAMTNEEGGVDPEESRYEVLVDRTNTTSTVWLGSTLGCSQCHNHKYDPFTQKDYFRLLSFFANNDYDGRTFGDGTRYFEPTLELATPEQEAARKELQGNIERLEQQLKAATPELTAAEKAWEDSLRASFSSWTAVTPTAARATNGPTLTLQPDGSILAAGVNAAATTYTVTARLPLANVTAVRIEALPDPSLPRGGPGRDGYGHFRVTGIHVEAGSTPIEFKTVKVDDSASAFDAAELLGVRPTAYSRKGGSWAINAMRDTAERLPRNAVLATVAPLAAPAGAELKITIDHLDGTIGQGIGRFRLWVTNRPDPLEGADLAPRLRKVLDVPVAQRVTAQNDELVAVFRATTPLLKETREALASRRKALADLKIPSTLVMREHPGFERPSFELRVRGSFSARGERVFAGTPRALHSMRDDLPANRLGLARWLVDPANPLVSRVVVNRLWEQLYGRGLVETSEDFGSQGTPPTHPELLDWLATELIAKGWSQKTLIKTMVMSATYRQSSAVPAGMAERDPYNRLLAHGPRVRMEAEMIRDASLSVSGLLSDKMFGPSVFPVQPDGIWNQPYSSDKWAVSSGEDRYRRSLYTFWRRTSPYPSFMTFDATSREFCTVRRVRTNTPLQALTLLNDPASFEAARALAERMVSGGSTPAARAARGVKLVLSRPAGQVEVDRLVKMFDKESAAYRQRGEPDPELAAWTLVANVLLNLDEAITKE